MFSHLFIENLQTDPPYFFAVVITVIVSITLHELAHGFAAIRLGDETPIETGHMTLNPIVHMGIFSFVLLAVAGIAFGAMPVDRTRLRGKYAESLVSAAGPATNILLALLGASGLALWVRFGHFDSDLKLHANGYLLLQVFTVYNFALAIFNMLPVPPLDGSWIVANIFPPYRRLMQAETMRGIMSALIFAMMIGGASFVFAAAEWLTVTIVPFLSGRADAFEFFS